MQLLFEPCKLLMGSVLCPENLSGPSGHVFLLKNESRLYFPFIKSVIIFRQSFAVTFRNTCCNISALRKPNYSRVYLNFLIKVTKFDIN